MPELQDPSSKTASQANSSAPQANSSAPQADSSAAQANSSAAQANSSARPDPLAALTRMSTTAGAGTVEYIAINPVAVAAALLGMASILVLLHDMLLVIPAAGIVCAIAALRQIRGSGGTQSGILPALVGLVLCLALGGGSVGYKLYQRWNFRNDEQQVAVVLQTLGRDLASASYNQAYALFGEHFRERVPEAPFAATWKEMVIQYNSGPITSIQWNNHALPVEDAPSDRPAVWAMALITFQRGDIIRQPVMLVREEGKWVIEDMPQTFPSTPKQRRSAAP